MVLLSYLWRGRLSDKIQTTNIRQKDSHCLFSIFSSSVIGLPLCPSTCHFPSCLWFISHKVFSARNLLHSSVASSFCTMGQHTCDLFRKALLHRTLLTLISIIAFHSCIACMTIHNYYYILIITSLYILSGVKSRSI